MVGRYEREHLLENEKKERTARESDLAQHGTQLGLANAMMPPNPVAHILLKNNFLDI